MVQEIKPNQRAHRRDTIGPYDAEKDDPRLKTPFTDNAHLVEGVRTFEAGRILKIGEGYRHPGELVPEACTWFRLQDLIHTGYLISVEVSEKTFKNAVQKYCPDLAEEISRNHQRS